MTGWWRWVTKEKRSIFSEILNFPPGDHFPVRPCAFGWWRGGKDLWKFANSVGLENEFQGVEKPREVFSSFLGKRAIGACLLWWVCLATRWYSPPSGTLFVLLFSFFFFSPPPFFPRLSSSLQGQFISLLNKWNMVLIKTACWLNNLCNFKNILNAEEEHGDVRNGLGPHYNSNRINKE